MSTSAGEREARARMRAISYRKADAYFLLLAILVCVIVGSTPAAIATETTDWSDLELLGRKVPIASKRRFSFIPDQSFEASYLNMPVFVARGASPGPTLCVTAGVHGDELNGVEAARRVFSRSNPREIRGTMIVLPAVNANGVRTRNRYLSDRRDLNRAFPGNMSGSVAAVIASAVFSVIREHCDALVDLHTGSDNRANLPQVRADLANPKTRDLAIHFGLGIVVGGQGPDSSLRREATKIGVPAILYEGGEAHRFQEHEIERGVTGIENVMAYLHMTSHEETEIPDARIYERSRWVRVPVGDGGFFFPTAGLGDKVSTGESLGAVIDPLTDDAVEISSPLAGEVIGIAAPQPVLSGYALFNLAWHD